MSLLPPSTLAWIAASIGPGAEVTGVTPQGGATSSTLNRIEARYQGRSLSLILRRFTNLEWLADEPNLAAHEASNLLLAARSGLPVPELLAFDADGSQASVPAILMTRLPGRVDLLPDDFDGWLRQQAEILLPLHTLPAEDYPWHYLPYNRLEQLQVPTWTTRPRLWERAIEIVNGPPPPARYCFIHRDYHPVNVLFEGSRLSGVVDWPNACRGPAGFDLSWNRINLASIYGVQAAARFLHHYQAAAGSQSDYHPHWDLMAVIESLPGPPGIYPPWIEYGVQGLTDRLMLERLEDYLASVLAKV